MRVLCALALVVAACAAASVSRDKISGPSAADQFAKFKAQFGKVYSATEESQRLAAFKANLEFIRKHNAEFEQGKHTHTVGVNQFADLTNAEWRAIRQRSALNRTEPRNEVFLPAATEDTVDWRTKGAVTPIKNQGQCGSCWSFSTTGSTEGRCAISTGNLVSLSEQQLMDCSTAYGNEGCNGGLMDYAFKYIIANGGLDTEADYPYTAMDGTCNKAKAAKHAASITGYTDVPQDNEAQLAAAVVQGPVSVAIEADQQSFQLYSSGVFTGPCGTALDHGVLVVGYTDQYWMVKNSWGTTWGDQGYIYMARGQQGTQGICGIAMEPSYPTAGAPGPSPPSPPPPPPSPSPPPPPGPASYHYEDPNSGGCRSDELNVEVTGLAGDFCSPYCTSGSCPTDLPPGTTARPQCILETAGSSTPTNCALICDPSADADGCPTNASCKAIQGIGLCTYDS